MLKRASVVINTKDFIYVKLGDKGDVVSGVTHVPEAHSVPVLQVPPFSTQHAAPT